MLEIIDSHVHLNLQQFDNDREEVFKRIEEKLIERKSKNENNRFTCSFKFTTI